MVALVEKYPSNINYEQYFDFEFNRYALTDTKIDKPKKADITLDFSVLDNEDFIILVGAEAFKFIAKGSGITQYQGYLIEDKYLPLTNPMMAKIKPEGKPAFEKAVRDINDVVSGVATGVANCDLEGITTEERAIEYLRYLVDNTDLEVLAFDTETSALDPREGYLLGVSISHREKQGVYISSDILTEECEQMLKYLFQTRTIVMHNGKFDFKWFCNQLGLPIPNIIEDTMMLHYLLDENNPHGLKALAIKYTDLGDYDRELDEFKRNYCKKHGIKIKEFTYDLIPFGIIYKYAAMDTAATLELYNLFKPIVSKSKNLSKVYNEMLIPGTICLYDMEENGVPFDKAMLYKTRQDLNEEIDLLTKDLYSFEHVKAWENETGNIFNPNSVFHLRSILFGTKYFGYRPTGKKTETGADSTDAEVLETLANDDDSSFPAKILAIKKAKKIKSTYIDKVLVELHSDGRLRTGFHLHTTTSGRLSSSGKLNMQQLPRDRKDVKKCIVAREGYEILSQDLKTAEMWVAAALSGDTNLQQIFKSDTGDFHSSIAHMVFKLPCKVEEVKEQFPAVRQAAKAISFGINL